MAELLLGPMLRHVGERDATVWVETDAPCTVSVLGHEAPTFSAYGHHYALVEIDDLEPGESHPYEVALDGERCWPEEGTQFPPSAIRTLDPDAELDIAFGSCRVALPHEPPYSLSKDEDERGAEVCALRVRALEMLDQPAERWPDLLLMLGDQVYVDEGAPATREFIRSRRDTSEPPGEGPVDYEEYARLYLESWSEPVLRWLFSVVPTAMIIDDHDIHDDWNISRSWLEEMERVPWWLDRVRAGFASYWIYQHLGNLSPRRLADDDTYRAVRESADDATAVIDEYARNAHDDREGIRWSYTRDLGRSRLVVIDSRAGRVVEEGRRSIFDATEGRWLDGELTGDVDHLLLATSDPFLLAHGMHYAEAWNEAVCDGAWGSGAAKLGERMRRAADFDHWAAFQRSFRELAGMLASVAAGERGDPPATVLVLSGDVHHAYLAEIGFPRGTAASSRVYQCVCSPYRNPLSSRERAAIRAAASRPAARLGRLLARTAGVSPPPIGWRFAEGPLFDNQIATISLSGRGARMRLEKTVPGHEHERRLDTSFDRELA